jgi:hypothetical protein
MQRQFLGKSSKVMSLIQDLQWTRSSEDTLQAKDFDEEKNALLSESQAQVQQRAWQQSLLSAVQAIFLILLGAALALLFSSTLKHPGMNSPIPSGESKNAILLLREC